MFCLSGPLLAAFGDNCLAKVDYGHEVHDSSVNISSKTSAFPYLEMDDTVKVANSLSQQVDDKTDSESSKSSGTTNVTSEVKKVPEVQILKTIGSGRFGFVRIGYCSDMTKFVVMNSYLKSILTDTCQQHIPKREKDILELLSHPFIVKLVGSFQDSHSLYLMLHLSRGGELSRLLMASNHLEKRSKVGNHMNNVYNLKAPLSEHQKMFYAACIVSVFKYAHSKNVLHRGLHPDTLYIDESGYLKVTDWGFAKVCDDHTFTLCGHVEYLCPEAILYDSGYGKGADYWALGVLIYEMLAGRSAFVARKNRNRSRSTETDPNLSALAIEEAFEKRDRAIDDSATMGPSLHCSSADSTSGFDDASTVENIISAQIDFPASFSAAACSIVSGLCQKNPSMRLGCVKNSRGIRDIMSHLWFADMDWEQLESSVVSPPWIPNTNGCSDFRHFGEGYVVDEVAPAFDGYHHVEWNAF